MHEKLHPKSWKKASGYSNGIAAEGKLVFLGGQIGWNADQELVSDDFIVQTEQALQNIVALLAEAGARPEHLVRLSWFVTDKREYLSDLPALGAAYRRVLGKNFPAMSVLQVTALLEDRAKVEIEATAVIPE